MNKSHVFKSCLLAAVVTAGLACKSQQRDVDSDTRAIAFPNHGGQGYDQLWTHFIKQDKVNPDGSTKWQVCLWMATNVNRNGNVNEGFRESDRDTNVFLNSAVSLTKDDRSPNGYYIDWEILKNYVNNNVKGKKEAKDNFISALSQQNELSLKKQDIIEIVSYYLSGEEMNVVLGDLKQKVSEGKFLPPKSNMCPKKENVRKIYQKASVEESAVSCPSGSAAYNMDDGNGWMCEAFKEDNWVGNNNGLDCRKNAGKNKGWFFVHGNQYQLKCVDPSTYTPTPEK